MSAPAAVSVPLDSIASCFEGMVPASICSCAADGTPNLTYLSIVHRLDARHVGLSYQFFNKTRKNILENPVTQVVVVSPETFYQYRLDLRYERTATEGPAFDRMKARLDAVASQTGMSRIFRLLGVDVYEVLDCRPLNSEIRAESAPQAGYLPELEAFTERLAACGTMDSLLDAALEAFSTLFGHHHSFVMAPDEDGKRLYTIASRGFEPSGVGSEACIGEHGIGGHGPGGHEIAEGILGVAAERRIIVRTASMTRERLFSQAVRSAVERRGEGDMLEKEIPLPGLPDVRSQLVAPLVAQNELLGVLCLQSAEEGHFRSDDERVIQIAARHLAASMAMLESAEPETRAASVIKHYAADDSIFIDDEYLIKGIAGRILWKLLQIHAHTGRTDFTNKEIRLDTSLGLPEFKDNLEARLILLRRRLEDRCDFVRLTPGGRGQLHLEVQRQLTLEEQ